VVGLQGVVRWFGGEGTAVLVIAGGGSTFAKRVEGFVQIGCRHDRSLCVATMKKAWDGAWCFQTEEAGG